MEKNMNCQTTLQHLLSGEEDGPLTINLTRKE